MASEPALLERYLVTLLVKLGVMASLASILARSSAVKAHADAGKPHPEPAAAAGAVVLRDLRRQRRHARPQPRPIEPSTWGWKAACSPAFWAGMSPGCLRNPDFACPPMFCRRASDHAAAGRRGRARRPAARLRARPRRIWRFSPFFDLSIYRFFKESQNYRRTVFHLAILRRHPGGRSSCARRWA